MREETGDLRSRLKYAVMRWCFKSVHLCVCSSRRECDYYARAFRWPERKLAFVTILTDPQWLTFANQRAEPFMVSAGRTFRDYATLLQAFDDSGPNLVIVTSKSSLAGLSVPPHVTVFYDLPLKELGELLARSMAVIVPLEDRPISIGQSVVLQAMAMGKPVIVTAVNGTVDYITHMETGLLVPPGDALALRDEAHRLAADERLRQRLGDAAIRQVRERHMPQQYAQAISSALAQSRRHTRRASS
jgi:glycosyltransferase involved in cell wall biosynthesis